MKSVDQAEILRAALTSATTDLHVACAGIVLAYDASTQTADIVLGARLPVPALDGTIAHDDPVTLPAVPIAWPSGGGYVCAFGLLPGDPVTVVFSDVAIGEYLETGSVSAPVDTRRHSMGYAMAIPGGARPKTKALTNAPAIGCVIGSDTTDAQIVINATEVRIGRAATDAIAKATPTDNAIEALRNKVNAIAEKISAGIPVVGGGGGAATFAIPDLAPQSTVAATLGKVQ